MPTTLPGTAGINDLRRPVSMRSSHLRVFLESALPLMLPPVVIVLATAACIGHGEISPRTIGAVFQASANYSACLEYADANPICFPEFEMEKLNLF